MIWIGKQIAERAVIIFAGALALAKFHTVGIMFISLAVSIFFYTLPFGVFYAVGICAVLFLHEIGHVLAAYVVGVRGSLPVFIPFLGAMIRLQRLPINVKMAANIAIGGPAAGSLGVLLCLAVYFWSDSRAMLILAYMGCMLNLFNLIPCEPLDGGKISAAISPYFAWLGSFIVGGIFFYTYNFIILLIFIVSLYNLWNNKSSTADRLYDEIAWRQRIKVFIWYMGLIFLLGIVGIYITTLL